ncbi:MAG TPA: LamG domain-containing protein [Pseudobacter sp.]|nr:LamG domain-containing protein [Pseudobacter sp.]
MKVLSVLSSGDLILLVFFGTTAPMSSCTKTETIRDTLIVKDTVTIPCNCTEEGLKKGLVAYYNFNNGSLQDSSGMGNHIVFNNAVKTTDRFGRANNAYLFDGTTSNMRVANSASLNPAKEISLIATIKPNGFYAGNCQQNQVLGKVSTDYENGIYWLRFGQSEFDCSNTHDINDQTFFSAYGNNPGNQASGVISHGFQMAKNQWDNVVYTYKDGLSKIYVNGELKNTAYKPSPFTPNQNDLYIGRAISSQYPYWFNGVIDEIRIYERAICEEEVKFLNESTK